MAVPTIHREPLHRASGRLFSSHLRPVTLRVVDQHLCCTRRHLHHPSQRPLLHRGRDRRNILVRLDTGLIARRHHKDSGTTRGCCFLSTSSLSFMETLGIAQAYLRLAAPLR